MCGIVPSLHPCRRKYCDSPVVLQVSEPFCLLGANIGTRQRYIRIYTERLIAYLNGNSLED